MKVFKTLLVLVLVAGVLGGAAYAGGRLLRDDKPDTVASSSGLPGSPSSSTPSSPTTSPSSPDSPTSSATHEAPVVDDVLKPGAKGTQVRELQQRLFQLAWLPETTTGVYDGRDRRGREGLPGQARPDPHGRPRPEDLAAATRDDHHAEPRRDVQRDARRQGALHLR